MAPAVPESWNTFKLENFKVDITLTYKIECPSYIQPCSPSSLLNVRGSATVARTVVAVLLNSQVGLIQLVSFLCGNLIFFNCLKIEVIIELTKNMG